MEVVQIKTEDRIFETPFFLRGSNRKICRNFFNCGDTSPTHMSTHLHACKYGQDCRDLNDPHHTNTYYHYKNPVCNSTGCDVTDPHHRCKYHHPGLPDYLIPCRYGNNCRNINDHKHLTTYSHLKDPVYPEIPKDVV